MDLHPHIQAAQRTLNEPVHGNIKLWEVLLGMAILGGGVYYIKKQMDDAAANKEKDSVQTDPNAQTAALLYSALTPDNIIDRYITHNPQNLSQVMDLALQVSDFAAVSKSYQTQYNRSLTSDLQTYLGDNYPIFMQRITDAHQDMGGLNAAAMADQMHAIIHPLLGLPINYNNLNAWADKIGNSSTNVPNNVYENIRTAYQQKFGSDLDDELTQVFGKQNGAYSANDAIQGLTNFRNRYRAGK